jgi:hypothetical protein
MQPGDRVRVTNLDGETASASIVRIRAETVAEATADFLDADDAVLLDYWRGSDVDPDAPVVEVALGTGVYDYPADRVEVLDDA